MHWARARPSHDPARLPAARAPLRPRAAHRSRARSALDLEPRGRPPVARARSGDLGVDAQSVDHPAERVARAPRGRRARPGVSARPRRHPQGAPPLSRGGRARRRARDARHRLLQHGVRPRRGAPALRGRAGDPGGRSPQVGERSRRSDGGRRPALSRGLLPPGGRRRRAAARALPVQRSHGAAHPTGPRLRGRMVDGLRRAPRPHRLAAGLARDGGARRALPPRQQRPGQRARRSRHHREALRRRRGDAPQAGDGPRHRRLAARRGPRPPRRRLPHERGAHGVRGPRAGARRHARGRPPLPRRPVGDPRGQRLHLAHAGHRGLRRLPRRAGRQVLPRRARHARRARHRPRRAPRPGAAAGGARRRAVPPGVPRHARRAPRERGEPAARRDQPRAVHAALPPLARGRDPDWPRDERRARPVLGFTGGRRVLDQDLRARPLADRRRSARGSRGARPGSDHLGAAGARARAAARIRRPSPRRGASSTPTS